MNRKELIKLLNKYEIEYEITDNTKEVEEGLRLLDEALEKIGIIIPKETQINNITRENDPEVPKYTTEWTNSSDLVFRQATIPPVIHSKHTETHECDCISRRDALKPFCITSDGTRIPEVDCDNFPVEFSVKDIKRHLLSLPPVEPKPVCEDAISKEWVLNEIITKVENDDSLTDEQKGSLSVAKYIIRHAPPVTPTERAGITTDMACSLHEEIRCEVLCTNPMKSDKGCDGGCQYDTDLLKRIDEVIEKVIVDSPTERTWEWVRRWHLSPDCYQEWQCSECEYEMDGKTNYCPNCGAKMKGGAE